MEEIRLKGFTHNGRDISIVEDTDRVELDVNGMYIYINNEDILVISEMLKTIVELQKIQGEEIMNAQIAEDAMKDGMSILEEFYNPDNMFGMEEM